MHKSEIGNLNWVMIWTEERKTSGLWFDKKSRTYEDLLLIMNERINSRNA
jgi:hypothetical protein